MSEHYDAYDAGYPGEDVSFGSQVADNKKES